jgi:predicted DCC family thiol-disulfide oxidoreductase YuxK
MLYDGECGFCRRSVEKWKKVTRERVAYEPYQTALARFPQVTEAQCRRAVQLIMPDDTVYSGAHAVFKSWALAGRRRWLLGLYERMPWWGRMAEGAYQWIARHRSKL